MRDGLDAVRLDIDDDQQHDIYLNVQHVQYYDDLRSDVGPVLVDLHGRCLVRLDRNRPVLRFAVVSIRVERLPAARRRRPAVRV